MTVLVTGSSGLVGSAAVEHFVEQGHQVVGIDNNMRRYFFGDEASTSETSRELSMRFGSSFANYNGTDIRHGEAVGRIVKAHKPELIIHAAAQPAHDWAAKEPVTDFTVNALGTLSMLEAARKHAPEATFVYCSTSKVYGDNPNILPLKDMGDRLDLPEAHRYYHGIDHTMSIDNCTHSLFGASKASADLLVQEYGRYFGMPTVCFRPGCISGRNHQGVKLHGFLAYLMRCAMLGEPYTVIGYEGKQVRCNIHASDLVRAFEEFHNDPIAGAVYNIGGGRWGSCSMIEAIRKCELISGRSLDYSYETTPRIGDHRWWISDNRPFQRDFPRWELRYDVRRVLEEIAERWRA